MKFKMDKVLTNGDGSPILDIVTNAPLRANEVLSGLINTNTNPVAEPMKFFGWANELYKEKTLTIDRTDLKKIVIMVEAYPSLALRIRGQLLIFLHEGQADQSLHERQEVSNANGHN